MDSVQEAPTVAPTTPKITATGIKPSKVAESIESRAIEKGLTEGFDGLAGFDPITIKGQSVQVAGLIKKDLARAERIMKGTEALPDGVRASSILIGLEKFAQKTGNAQLLNDLANSPLAAETSIFAQELRMLRERTPFSPVKIIRDVKKAREETFKKRTKKSVKQTTKSEITKAKTQIKKSASGRQGWEDFIQEIRCK